MYNELRKLAEEIEKKEDERPSTSKMLLTQGVPAVLGGAGAWYLMNRLTRYLVSQQLQRASESSSGEIPTT